MLPPLPGTTKMWHSSTINDCVPRLCGIMPDCFRNTRRFPDVHVQEVSMAFKLIIMLDEKRIGNIMNFDKTCWETHLGCRAEIWPSEGNLDVKLAKMGWRAAQNVGLDRKSRWDCGEWRGSNYVGRIIFRKTYVKPWLATRELTSI